MTDPKDPAPSLQARLDHHQQRLNALDADVSFLWGDDTYKHLASRLDAQERVIEQLAQRINILEAWVTALIPRPTSFTKLASGSEPSVSNS